MAPTSTRRCWPRFGATPSTSCASSTCREDINNKVLAAVRRLRRGQANRGKGGRKPRRRGSKAQGTRWGRRRRRGPKNKDKAAFVYKHRFLIVKRMENLTKKDWAN